MQLKGFYSLMLLITFFLSANAQQQAEIITYINTYKVLAMQEMQRTGVPAAIKLAQGIHETQAGTSDLVRKSNNHFGIKCKAEWQGEKVYHDDDKRGECFRSYDKPDDSYRDHSDFLKGSPRYASLFQLDPTDYKSWAYGLKKAGYATNYRYPEILVKLIEDYNLEQYSLIALGKLQPSDEVLAGNGSQAPVVITDTSAVAIGDAITVNKIIKPEKKPARPEMDYPPGEFVINNARVVFVKAGTALLTVAEEYNISFARLLDFNDLNSGDIIVEDQLIFLQRKRKTGANEFHITKEGETLYDICQSEGIRMESLLSYNLLNERMQPAEGEKLNLQHPATSRPILADEKKAVVTAPVLSPAGNEVTTHIVQTKETLYSISKKYGVSLEQIKEWNKLDSLDLRIGQQLVIKKNQ
jgi:LysM repeat protein